MQNIIFSHYSYLSTKTTTTTNNNNSYYTHAKY